MTDQIVRLPMPETLEPKNAARSLLQNVRGHFYSLYKSEEMFRELLGSVGNKDSIHKHRMFDRQHAISMIKERAEEAKDMITSHAAQGDVYKCVVDIMRKHPELGLKLRRSQYKQLEHQQAAE